MSLILLQVRRRRSHSRAAQAAELDGGGGRSPRTWFMEEPNAMAFILHSTREDVDVLMVDGLLFIYSATYSHASIRLLADTVRSLVQGE